VGLLAELDAEMLAVLPFGPAEAADVGPTPVDLRAVRARQGRIEHMERLGAPEDLILKEHEALRSLLEAAARPEVPCREDAVPVRLRGAVPPGPPEVGLWVGYDGEVLAQRADGLHWSDTPALLQRGVSVIAPEGLRMFPPQAWPLRTVWKDPWHGHERYIAIFGDTPRWSLDPDGVRALDGVAMLDLATGEWLAAVPERMQVCQERIPAVVGGGVLASYHLETGVVSVTDVTGEVEYWDPVWCTVDGRIGGCVEDKPVLAPEEPPVFDVGGPGSSRLRRGTAGFHHHGVEGLVVGRDGVVGSTREGVLPRLVGDLVAVAICPVFDAPVVMTSADIRFLQWSEPPDRDSNEEVDPHLELRLTLV
jgi:hypothetical protein